MRLRIGLHGGRPTLTDHGYVGLSVHTVARICFAGHGGQILLSGSVRDAVVESLDDEVSLTSLGSWRFEGLTETIDIYQVDALDALEQFPPLRSGTRVSAATDPRRRRRASAAES